MKILGRTTSMNVQKVLWLLDELALEYEQVQLGGRHGGLDTPAFLALNPVGKIPVLIDKEQAIWESHTILRYIAAQYGGDIWFPQDAYTRSLHDRWIDWAQANLQVAFMEFFFAYYRTPAKQHNMAVIDKSIESCNAHLAILDQTLANTDYLAGDQFSLADIPAGSMLYRMSEINFGIMLPTRVEAWYQRLQQRQPFRERSMVDFSELQG